MIKIKILKETEKCKVGEIVNATKKNAESYVKEGYAEYVIKPKKKKVVNKKIVKEIKKLNPITIPERIKGFNFVLIGKYIDKQWTKGDGKKPGEQGWQNKIYNYDNVKLQEQLKKGWNYGVQSNNSHIIIDGVPRFLIVLDFDTKEFQDNVFNLFPETFTTTSGSPKNCNHIWLASDDNKAFKIKDENRETLADVIGSGNQVIAPGSIHNSGSVYSIVKDIPIAFMPYSEIEAILKPHDKTPKKEPKPKKDYKPKDISSDITEDIYNSMSMENVLLELGIDTSKNPTNCFGHSSKGGACFSFDNETAHCFHCDGSWNKFSLVREAKNLTDKETFEWFAEKTGRTADLEKSRKEYKERKKKITFENSFSRRGQIETFWEKQPFYYDRSGIFWLWESEFCRWERGDEVDYLNSIQDTLGIETIGHTNKTELITGFKQIGRRHKPEDMKKSWVQFKDKIYDVKTGNSFKATPEYFVTNPIPWKVGVSEETPTIDKYFIEWVGEENKQILYEFMAYNLSLDKFMQRIFAFCGGGSNGKGTVTKLNLKFLGDENCVASEIKDLSDNRFALSCLYRKLLCVMGEVSSDDLKNTNVLKKLGGEDKIPFEFKGKDPFTDDNTATCVCLTNSLPTTPDKSLGFYRKWLIIDFPNQFSDMNKDIIGSIPEVEFENLAKKCLRILKELYENPKFHNEGNFEERMKRYEDRSNPVIRFVESSCEEEDGEMMILRDFTNLCNLYLKSNHLRIQSAKQIGRVLRDEGFIVGSRKVEGGSAVVILNLKFVGNNEKSGKLPLIPLIPLKSQFVLCNKTNRKLNGNNSFNGNQVKNSKIDFKKLNLGKKNG